MNRKCGTCRWWIQIVPDDNSYGQCSLAEHTLWIHKNNICPCWQAKEAVK